MLAKSELPVPAGICVCPGMIGGWDIIPDADGNVQPGIPCGYGETEGWPPPALAKCGPDGIPLAALYLSKAALALVLFSSGAVPSGVVSSGAVISGVISGVVSPGASAPDLLLAPMNILLVYYSQQLNTSHHLTRAIAFTTTTPRIAPGLVLIIPSLI